MRKSLVSASAVILAMGLVLAGTAFARELKLTKKAGEYTMDITLDKNPPVVGDNIVTVKITDATGKPVTDARVRVEYSMPAMPGMPAANYHTDAELKGQAYKAKLELPMGGSWNTTVKMKRADNKVLAAQFNLEAQ